MGNERCIMPEMPYCPMCEYGHVVYPDYFDPDDDVPVFTEWICLLDLFG